MNTPSDTFQKIKRFVMKDLFKDLKSKEFIDQFEEAIYYQFNCDAHYLMDVVLDSEDEYFFYEEDEVQFAFKVTLFINYGTLTKELQDYYMDNIINKDLFLNVYNS